MLPSSSDQDSSLPNPQVDPAKVAEVLAKLEEINLKKLKQEMKNQVELAMKKYQHINNPEVYGQKSWEIFDAADFTAVCRALAVRSREAAAEKWNLQHGSLEGVKLSDEDLSQMRDSVDFYFHMRKVCLPHKYFFMVFKSTLLVWSGVGPAPLHLHLDRGPSLLDGDARSCCHALLPPPRTQLQTNRPHF